jgi:hypothetical protein
MRLSWNDLNQRDYSRLELADKAAEVKRIEREIQRAEAARKFRAEAVRHSATLVLADMPASEQAAKAGREHKAAKAMADAAAGIGVSVSELAEAIAVERALVATSGGQSDRPAAEAGQRSELDKAARADVAKWTREALASEAAKAGREALAAIGPRASAVVITKREAAAVAVAEVRPVPNLEAAAKRADVAAARLAEAREALAEAETKVAAAEATKAVRPIREANREADRIAASVAKLAKRAEAADKALAAAASVASLPAADGLIFVPVAAYPLAEADRASELELPVRPDRMPARFVERGPSAKVERTASDPTGDSAAALADGYRRTLARAEALAAKLAARTSAEALEQAAAEAREAKRTEDKAKRALAARNRRRNAKLANR